MKKKRQVVISILGMAYIEPLIDLYSKLNQQNFSKFSKTKVSLRENGYSISIIVLSVLLVESIINRIKYLEKSKTKNNLEFFKSFCNDNNLISYLTEIYIVRDLIVHNHIWRTSYDFDEKYNEIRIYQKLLDGYGDQKYKDNISKKKKITKILKIHVVPMNIGKEDVIKTFKVLQKMLKFLEEKESSKTKKIYFPITGFQFKYNNEDLDFYQILEKIIRESKVNS